MRHEKLPLAEAIGIGIGSRNRYRNRNRLFDPSKTDC